MRFLLVDEQALALQSLGDLIRRILPTAVIESYHTASLAFAAAALRKPDVALLDISMQEMDGLELAKKLQEINPFVNIVFTAASDEYAKEALAMHASGYLLKPITEKKLREELSVLRFAVPGDEPEHLKTDLFVRAFGNFEVFYKGHPVHFQYRKTRELFAYLIDRNGALCSNSELIGILWEESNADQKRPYLQRIRADLTAALRTCGAEDVLVHYRGELGVAPERLHCDYFAWLRGEPCETAVGDGRYHGEYMSQYSWAESTNGWLSDPDTL